MRGVNKAILLGNAGGDAKSGETRGGEPWAQFSICTSHKGRDGEKVPTWHNVKCFGRIAEWAGEIRKGDPVFVEGAMQHEQWEKDGQKHERTVVRAWLIQTFVRREGGGGQRGPGPSGGNYERSYRHDAGKPQGNSRRSGGGFEDDEVPF